MATTVDETLVAATARENTIEEKLLVLAWDVSEKAMLERLKEHGLTRPRSAGIHSVAHEHSGADYRLVWEYHLLRPLDEDTRDRLVIEALYTVSDIGEP